MTRSFARDLGPHRIRVNTVVPGWVMTERQKQLWVTPRRDLDHRRQRQCLPDLIEPAHIAANGAFPRVGRRRHVHVPEFLCRSRIRVISQGNSPANGFCTDIKGLVSTVTRANCSTTSGMTGLRYVMDDGHGDHRSSLRQNRVTPRKRGIESTRVARLRSMDTVPLTGIGGNPRDRLGGSRRLRYRACRPQPRTGTT